MNILDILSGTASKGYENRMAGQAELEKMRNTSLFDLVKEKRTEGKVREAMGTPGGVPGPWAEGLESTGTGMFSENPQVQAESLAMMNLAAPTSFQPAFTQSVKPEAAPAGLKPGTLQKIGRKTAQGPEEVSVRYLGGPVEDPASWEEVGARALVQPFQSKRSELKETSDYEYYQGLHGTADKTASTAANYDRINRIADAAGIETGFGDPAILMGKKIAQRMGLGDFEDENKAREAVDAEFSRATIELMKPDDATGKRAIAGQSSDKELDFFKKIPVGLGMTKAGRELIAKVARHRAERADAISQMGSDAWDMGVPSNRFKTMVRNRFKDSALKPTWIQQNVDVPPEWEALLDRAEKEIELGKPALDTSSLGVKLGDVEDGYEYLGGDPGNPNSWKKR